MLRVRANIGVCTLQHVVRLCFLCSHALPYIVALYEAKLPNVLRSKLVACKRKAILEYIAVNNMDSTRGANQ